MRRDILMLTVVFLLSILLIGSGIAGAATIDEELAKARQHAFSILREIEDNSGKCGGGRGILKADGTRETIETFSGDTPMYFEARKKENGEVEVKKENKKFSGAERARQKGIKVYTKNLETELLVNLAKEKQQALSVVKEIENNSSDKCGGGVGVIKANGIREITKVFSGDTPMYFEARKKENGEVEVKKENKKFSGAERARQKGIKVYTKNLETVLPFEVNDYNGGGGIDVSDKIDALAGSIWHYAYAVNYGAGLYAYAWSGCRYGGAGAESCYDNVYWWCD